MQMNASAPNIGLIEKEYPYRSSGFAGIVLIFLFGLFSLMTFLGAVSGDGIWSWIGAIFFFVLLVFFLYLFFVGLFGNRRLIITKKDLYLPIVWKSETYTLIPFSEITMADLIEVQGNAVLRIFVRRKEFTITYS